MAAALSLTPILTTEGRFLLRADTPKRGASPRTRATPASAARPEAAARTTAAAPPVVLVVEDDPAIRQLMVATLSEDGFAVEAAVDGAEALEYVRRASPAAIVLDLSMPVMDGREFLNAYRDLEARRTPERRPAPVIVCTALHHPEEEARRVGADACLPKPFDLDDLAAVVDRLTERSDARRAPRRVQTSAAG